MNRTALRAGFVLADAIGSSWGDAAVHFTCSEADGIALALRLLGQRELDRLASLGSEG